VNERFYTLADYKEFFNQASLPLQSSASICPADSSITSTKWSTALTHARYAFVGKKPGRREKATFGHARKLRAPHFFPVALLWPRTAQRLSAHRNLARARRSLSALKLID